MRALIGDLWSFSPALPDYTRSCRGWNSGGTSILQQGQTTPLLHAAASWIVLVEVRVHAGMGMIVLTRELYCVLQKSYPALSEQGQTDH